MRKSFSLIAALTLMACAADDLERMDTMEDNVAWCAEERPVFVTLTDHYRGTDCEQAFEAGTDFWADQGAGYLSFAIVPDWQVSDTVPNPRHINVSKEAPEDVGASGDTRVARLTPECLNGAVIRIDPYWCRPGSNTAAHELGHALGLAHVSDPKNLMFPGTAGGWRLTEAQLAHVR